MTVLVALAIAALSASPPSAITIDALRAHQAGVRALTADVLQVKEGRLWARPFESRVRLRFSPERVEWETVAPLRSTIVIEGQDLSIRGPSGERRDLGPIGRDPRFGALLRFLNALLALDVQSLERDCELAFGPGEVVVHPRPGGALALFKRVTLRFGGDLNLSTLELETDDERTRLSFTNVRYERASSPKRPAAPAPDRP